MFANFELLVEQANQKIFESNVAAAVHLCCRISRLKNDPFNFAFFLSLQENSRGEVFRYMLSEYSDKFDNEFIERVYKKGVERALDLRTMPEDTAKQASPDAPDRKVLYIGSNLIDSEIASAVSFSETFKPPSGMSAYDTAHFHQQALEAIPVYTARKYSLNVIKARMLSACSDYVSRIEKQIVLERESFESLRSIQDGVFAFLREYSNDAHAQFSIAIRSIKSGNREDLSTSMTHLRRCLRSLADLVYPADNTIEGLSEDKYLNRLSKFITDCRNDFGFLTPIDLKGLETLLRDVNDRASKGVHNHVSFFEAQQVLVAAILYIDNVGGAWEQKRKNQV